MTDGVVKTISQPHTAVSVRAQNIGGLLEPLVYMFYYGNNEHVTVLNIHKSIYLFIWHLFHF